MDQPNGSGRVKKIVCRISKVALVPSCYRPGNYMQLHPVTFDQTAPQLIVIAKYK